MIAAIDFGASATKAAVYLEPGGEVQPVTIDGAPEFSSAVFLDGRARLLCGVAAQNSARNRQDRLRGALKRRVNRPDAIEPVHQEVDFTAVVLLPLVRCIATVIGYAWSAVLEHTGGKEVPLLLTHPVGWSEAQRATLLEAARVAGVEPAGLLTEAEAVGWNICAKQRPDSPLLVVDLGASTLDIALLNVTATERIEVLYSDGDNYIGGDDFDHVVLGLVDKYLSLEPEDADLLAQFRQLCETRPQIAAREAELVKLKLAAEDVAVFAYGDDLQVPVRQDRFEQACAHLVDRIVGRARRAIEQGGAAPKTMVVSGGGALLPIVRDSLASLAQSHGISLLGWEEDGLPGTPTTAVALGAARMPRPWGGTEARADRPATVVERFAEAEYGVAVPGALMLPHRDWTGQGGAVLARKRVNGSYGADLSVGRAGVRVAAYDPSDDRVVAASQSKTVSVWQLRGDEEPLHVASYWRARVVPPQEPGTVTAVAVRGDLVAWTESVGPGVILADGWRSFHPGFAVRWLRFVAGPYLVAAGDDRLVLIHPRTHKRLDTLALSESDQPTAVAISAEPGLVFTASGKSLRSYRCDGGRFSPGWKSSVTEVPALAAARVQGRATLVVFDATRKVYRALDARTGEQFALKDASLLPEPSELLSDGVTGVLYPRYRDGRISLLSFAGDRR